ncbi:hypothetical protein [Listeria fleischmannii]|uniref:Uncharacterized protein n=1 Tax=Listeria fleischmannii FSL S10-1203 TaxID=1265822 RepID=W7D4Y0_9LIST|nr:hypothetical protein [Listeria fleischmannii]EUJ44045.1 hypothetical protein MCOL2_20161 [Listeria fleischmannii FSL S10-1203]
MEKMDFSSLLSTFGVPLKLYTIPDKKGEYVKGEWVPFKFDKSAGKNISEPFVPSSLMTQMPNISEYAASRIEKYEMIWFSSEVVPLKSIILTQDGKEFSVEESIPYTDYSNVTQYGCEAVSISDSKFV